MSAITAGHAAPHDRKRLWSESLCPSTLVEGRTTAHGVGLLNRFLVVGLNLSHISAQVGLSRQLVCIYFFSIVYKCL